MKNSNKVETIHLKEVSQGREEQIRTVEEFSMISRSICGEGGVLELHRPYRFADGHIITVLQGNIRSTANLLEYTLSAGETLLLPPNCIIELLEMSKDTQMKILSYSDDCFSEKNHQVICVFPSAGEQEEITMLTELIWRNLGRFPHQKGIILSLYQALQSFIINIYAKETDSKSVSDGSRKHELFQRFLHLVNEHCIRERSVSFYASELCITPHHLSTIIKKVSGINATIWINRAVCLEARIRLRDKRMSINQISEELNFPNPAFFNKFFKRETGHTPGKYKAQNRSSTNL